MYFIHSKSDCHYYVLGTNALCSEKGCNFWDYDSINPFLSVTHVFPPNLMSHLEQLPNVTFFLCSQNNIVINL